MTDYKVAAIVLAGGSGERFGKAGGKQLAAVAGRPVVAWSVLACDAAGVDTIVVVCHPDRVEEYRRAAVEPLELSTPVRFASGGPTRQASTWHGLAEVAEDTDIVLIHDGARPLVTADVIRRAIQALVESPGADGVVVGHPSVDTVKVVDGNSIVETPDRERIWTVQTPQVFWAAPLRDAFETAHHSGFTGTDDASLVERNGGTVLVTQGPRDNIKVTLPPDIDFVEAVLLNRLKGD